MDLLKSESYKRGAIYSTGFNLLAKALAFANSMVIAYYFGTQVKTDIYFYSLATISMLMGLVTSLDHSVIIPEAMRIRQEEGEAQSQKFFNFFLFIYFIIGLLSVGVLYIDPVNFFVLISQFDISTLSHNIFQIYAIIPLCILMLFTNFLIDIFSSYKFFTLPMITSLVNSVLSLVFIILFHRVWDVTSMIVAQIVSYSFNIIWLLFLLKKKICWNFQLVKIHLRPLVIQNIVYSQFANFFTFLGTYVPMYLLSGFSGGIITCLNYGRNLSEIPRHLLIGQISIVSGIKLNELYATYDLDNLNLFFQRTIKFMVFVMMPISGIFYLFSEEIVIILYQRGNFGIESVAISALFLRYLGLLLPLYAIDTMFARLNMAGQNIKTAFGYQVISNILVILFAILFISNIGFIGYALALIVCYLLGLFAMYYIIHKHYSSIEYIKIIKYFFMVLFINACIACLVYISIYHIKLPILWKLLFGSFLYSIILLLLNHIIKLNDDANSMIRSFFIQFTHFN